LDGYCGRQQTILPKIGGTVAGKFELFKDKGGAFRFRLKAGNGETVLSSEGYASKASAMNGIKSVQTNAGDPARFEATETAGRNFRFNLKAKNNQVIGTSESYNSASGRDNGISAVGRAANGAKVVDLSQG
jgi:uncharacterized protein YegP (UPF0339 family)